MDAIARLPYIDTSLLLRGNLFSLSFTDKVTGGVHEVKTLSQSPGATPPQSLIPRFCKTVNLPYRVWLGLDLLPRLHMLFIFTRVYKEDLYTDFITLFVLWDFFSGQVT